MSLFFFGLIKIKFLSDFLIMIKNILRKGGLNVAIPQSSGLYPPIFETYAPVFIGETCKVYFEISPYMEKKAYQLEVVVNEQKRNTSVLSGDSEYLIKNTYSVEEGDKLLSNQYYFTISNTEINGGFLLNTFYRVQARIVQNGVKSEWSTVCLIRRISDFSFTLAAAAFSTPIIKLIGSFSFDEQENIETIKSAQISLLSGSTILVEDELLLNQDLYQNENSFSYLIPFSLTNGSYFFVVKAETKNGAEKIFTNTITVNYTQSEISSTVNVVLDKENGLFEINVDIKDILTNSQLVILRADSLTNFKEWQELHIVPLLEGSAQKYSWQDKTVEFGVWYKYSLQIASNTNRSQLTLETEPQIAIFEDSILTTQEKQLKVSLNKSISSFSRNLSQSKIDTLGSKYPYIVRNGSINYYTFPLSGTISYLGNNEEVLFAADAPASNNIIEINKSGLFETKQSLYKENYERYEAYNLENNISNINDTYLERRFREKVEEFLNNFQPKLYRSPTEGNLLIQLTDISMTPNSTLGGYIYDFSCTATEIAECTIENFDKNNIQLIGALEEESITPYNTTTTEKVGQI